MAALIELARFHVDCAPHLASRPGHVGVFKHVQLCGHTGEEVGGLGIGIRPLGPMAAISFLALGHRIAVGEQHGEPCLVGMQGASEACHHIRAVGIGRDPAEPLSFALGEVAILGTIQAGELRVLIGLDRHAGFQHERSRDGIDCQFFIGMAVLGTGEGASVHTDGFEHQVLSIQDQGAPRSRRVPPHGAAG